MNEQQILMLANMTELGKRILERVIGNDLSTKVDGQDVSENAEIMIGTKLREKLSLKGVK